MFASKDLFFTNNAGGYNINRSVRLRSSASAYLNRTPGIASNQTVWTLSAWVKRGTLGAAQYIFEGYTNGSNSSSINFTSSDQIQVSNYVSASVVTNKITTAVYRDPSAWYHIVVSSNGSSALNIYVNGVQITSFATNVGPTSANWFFNGANSHMIGRESSGGSGNSYIDGYFAEFNWIDGQALTPTSFGAYNATTGVWQPIKYAGTYGTNGFYLNFSNNASTTTLGYDTSGNGNNWTTNNISLTAGTTYDSMTDVPTLTSATVANYAVINPTVPTNAGAVSDGNLTWTLTGSFGTKEASMASDTLLQYAEFYVTSGLPSIGVKTPGVNLTTNIGTLATGYWGIYDNGASFNIFANGSTLFSGSTTVAAGQIWQIAYNPTTGNAWIGKNNVYYNSSGGTTGNPSAGTNPTFSSLSSGLVMFVSGGNVNAVLNANFGQRPFTYTPPTGFVALNTYNLPTPTIKNGAAYMAATTWTGVSTSSAITLNNGTNNTLGVTFQPDFVWGKTRSLTYNHQLYDSVRGTGKLLISNTTDAQQTNFTYGYVSAFNSNGFTASPGATDNENWNTTSATYVAWQWSKGNTQGFAIVSQTLSTTGINTITHNLGVVPTMVIAKRTDATEAWLVYQSSGTTQSQYLSLNSTAAVASSANLWGSSAFTSTQIYFNGTSGNTYVFYIYAPVAGFSKFGSYTGNGSTDGPFVFTNFRPRWIMVKRTDSTGDWYVYDTSRGSYNATNAWLQPDTSSAENSSTSWEFDILSNGFKVRNNGAFSNASGGTYIYAAFAENPFNYSLAR